MSTGQNTGCASVMSEDSEDELMDTASASEFTKKTGYTPFVRRVSTAKQLKNKVCIKEGYLMKQSTSFQRWRKFYFRLKGKCLYYAKDIKADIFEEISIDSTSLAEHASKVNGFILITPRRCINLAAESRKEMDEWICALKSSMAGEYYESDMVDMLSSNHRWSLSSHARPTFCNVCKDAVAVISYGLSCEVCKMKVHKKCAIKTKIVCKWTTRATMEDNLLSDNQTELCHQWLCGNLPVNSKCAVCEKACGSVLRLQDYRCLWCKCCVHYQCQPLMQKFCSLGSMASSILPPQYLTQFEATGGWPVKRIPGVSPLLVLVNSRAGDCQGLKFARKLRQMLNPAQVFELANGGPKVGLTFFSNFDPFRVLVCGGDGTLGWVLSEIDNLDLQSKVRLGVLPLGTGNDMSRVLGWGSSCDADLSVILERLDHASTRLLDRWSILSYVVANTVEHTSEEEHLKFESYAHSVDDELAKMFQSDASGDLLNSANSLSSTINDFVNRVTAAQTDATHVETDPESITSKCIQLQQKLNSLLQVINDTAAVCANEENSSVKPLQQATIARISETDSISSYAEVLDQLTREKLMSRANSVKKAVRQVIATAEQACAERRRQSRTKTNLRRELSTSYPLIVEPESSSNYITSDSDCELKSSEVSLALNQASSHSPCKTSTSDVERRCCGQPTDGSSSDLLSPPRPHGTRHRRLYTNPVKSMRRKRFFKRRIDEAISDGELNQTNCPKDIMFDGSHYARTSPNFRELRNVTNLSNAFSEKGVMNNYFSIGLDACIALDFHQRREEHPEKFRSRSRNKFWYGMLGTKQFITQRSFRNLGSRLLLECDGRAVPLPRLQGLAILNIPSYAGGVNFWGSSSDGIFVPPAYDDKLIEVLAVFGSSQMAISRLVKVQHHRIAQCSEVKITILGDEGIPVQIDGEAWLQPPGFIWVRYKNQAQMLCRSADSIVKQSPPSSSGNEEIEHITSFVKAATSLTTAIRSHSQSEANVVRHSELLEKIITREFPNGDVSEFYSHTGVLDAMRAARDVCVEVTVCFTSQTTTLTETINRAAKLLERSWRRLAFLIYGNDYESLVVTSKRRKDGRFAKLLRRHGKKRRDLDAFSDCFASVWSTEDVAQWLDSIHLSEYKETFIRNDIRGSELMLLERYDLKDLGVIKVGHIKRILRGVKDLQSGYSGGVSEACLDIDQT